MKLQPDWVDGLPIAIGRLGLGKEYAVGSHVSVQGAGGMEEELFIATVLFYVSLYKDILHPTFVWDNGTLIMGKLFIKIDSGIGCQAKTKINVQFRYGMHKLGAYIGPGLQNSTQATQEIDNLYETFKGMTDTASQEVFTRKAYERNLALEGLAKA